MKNFVLLSLLALMGGCLFAQSTNVSTLFQSNFRKAEKMYNQQSYRNAIDLYRITLDKDPTNHLAKERVADCYYRMGRYNEAWEWYKNLSKDGNPDPKVYYQLGQILSILEEYDSAKFFFQKFAKDSGADRRGVLKVDFINSMELFRRDSNSYTINRQWYNSEEADFSPQHFGKGIVFVSSRDRDLFIKRRSLSGVSETEGLLNAYYAEPSFDSTKSMNEQVDLFYSKSLNSPYHDGPVTFYDNGNKIAFTRNILRNGKPVKDDLGRVNLELYFASLGDHRTMVQLMRFPFSSDSYSIAHPWISNDGKVLYFSSNMPGGYGGSDLYVSYYVANNWTKPKNLGENVNTAGDESSPFLWNNELLFFSSNGFGGFGGLDNFVSLMIDSKLGVSKNMGYPINTSVDDFGLILDPSGKEGFFASNRNTKNDDVYAFKLNKATLVGHLSELNSQLAVPQALVNIKGEKDEIIHSLKTDDLGNFIADLEIDRNYRLVSEKEGYTTLSERLLSTVKSSVLVDTINLSIWKHELFAKGIVYSNELQTHLPGAVVTLRNLSTGRTDSVSTSGAGAYNFLVHPNNSYRITARYPGYLESGFILNTAELFKGDLVNDVLLEEKYIEKLTVLFDYDKWDLRPEFVTDVNKVLRSLNRFKDATVNIGAHADSRGTIEHNQKLSERRAQTILNYFRSKGIKLNRIEAVGFGEELILNVCSDGVECTDIQHLENRRAEIKVLLEGAK